MAGSLRVNDLLPDSRLEQIELAVRREFPRLPDDVIFNTYIQPEGTADTGAGIEVPVPAVACIAILVPNPKWPEKMPQYRAVVGQRWLSHWTHYEKQRERLVNAPDVALMDFRAAARKAIEVAEYGRNLLN